RTDTAGRSRVGSHAPAGTLGASQSWTWARGLTHGGCRHWQVPTGAGAEGPSCQRTSYAVGMSEFGVLSKHRALSLDRSVPTYTPMAARRDPGRKIGQTRTRFKPVSIAPRRNGTV